MDGRGKGAQLEIRQVLNRLALLMVSLAGILVLSGAAGGGPEEPAKSTPASLLDPAAAVMPGDATGRCADGTWSTAEQKQGACSGHGGVQSWFGPPPKKSTARCHDGTYSRSENSQGACSGHGGVRTWYGKPPRGATARCRDGTYSTSPSAAGTCSNHGGVRTWLKSAER